VRPHHRLIAALTAGYAALALLASPYAKHAAGDADGATGWLLALAREHAIITSGLTLVVLTFAALFVPLLRMMARARLRALGADPLARVRGWVEARPGAAAALFAAPTILLAQVNYFWMMRWHLESPSFAALALGALAPVLGALLLSRQIQRAALAPLVDATDAVDGEGFLFSAVAVTRESRAAVGALGAVSLGMVALLAAMPLETLGASGFAMLAAYTALAGGAAAAFQRASRIAIGLDGLLVRGTSRTRFHAYRDLDDVEVTPGGEIVLRRHGRLVLRLQLHGADAGRREAIVQRLRDAVVAARSRGGGAAARLAEAASPALLAQAARGDGNYRAAGATREELWELVEAPATAPAARARAADALAIDGDGPDRRRLRVAAERCADPPTRDALRRVAATAEEEEAAEQEAAPGPRRLARGR
jgi:hypothetical protein